MHKLSHWPTAHPSYPASPAARWSWRTRRHWCANEILLIDFFSFLGLWSTTARVAMGVRLASATDFADCPCVCPRRTGC